MYMPGLRRTGSSPSRTRMSFAVYVAAISPPSDAGALPRTRGLRPCARPLRGRAPMRVRAPASRASSRPPRSRDLHSLDGGYTAALHDLLALAGPAARRHLAHRELALVAFGSD